MTVGNMANVMQERPETANHNGLPDPLVVLLIGLTEIR
jgi:hypothetical protein